MRLCDRIDSGTSRGAPPWRGGLLAVLAAVLLSTPAFALLVPPARAAPPTPNGLSDDFTHDASLNASLWQINGPVGSVLGPDDAGVTLVPLAPAFSSAGMEIAQVNGRQEVGTIQSVGSFVPPFTATAVVKGTTSNGHTFGFAISTANASSGVLIYGNVNDTNCSNLFNCGDPTVCGNSANPGVPPNQCYYGLDAKVGQGGHWPPTAKLYLTPAADTYYTLQISVDSSGNARFSVGQGGQVLGTGTAQVGVGPFYLVLEQAEGSPVGSGRLNTAYWMSASLGPLAPSSGSSTTTTSPGPTSSGIPVDALIVAAIIIVALLLLLLLWYSRRRKFTVFVQDSQTSMAIKGAAVRAVGPEGYSGTADGKGRAIFPNPKEGDYSVQAAASGYVPSAPATVKVEKDGTECFVKLDRGEGRQSGTGGTVPHEGPWQPSTSGAGPPGPGGQTAPPVVPAASRSAPPLNPQPTPEFEGWGGDRISQIIATFQAKGAISPETALTAKELGLSRLFVRIMERRRGRTKVFIEVNGRYYLNQEALQANGGSTS